MARRFEGSGLLEQRGIGLIVLALGLLLGCGVEPKPYSGVCRDPQSNACVPCPGVENICVDPASCRAVPCGADALFGPKDADTGSGDGVGADSQDAAAKDASSDLDAGPEIDASAGTDAIADVAKDTLAASPDVPEVFVDTLVDSADAGACKEPCPALNLVECLPGVAATRTCQWTAAGCLNWATPMACAPGLICSNGLCQPSSPCPGGCPSGSSCQGGACAPSGGGSLTCAQITACIGNCPANDASCPDTCKSKGSANGLQLLSDYQGCLKAVCKSLADQGKFNETMLCVYSNCFSEQAACIGSGSGDCKAYADCLAPCGSSATCTSACNTQVGQTGAKDYYGLMTCVDNNCTGLSGQDQVNCAQSSCKTGWDKCFGSGTYLYTTCLQVAQCQGKCGGDTTCAKACKAAASPLAQAAVDAFITCRENKCGNYCVNTASPNCSSCITQYCATELATCSI